MAKKKENKRAAYWKRVAAIRKFGLDLKTAREVVKRITGSEFFGSRTHTMLEWIKNPDEATTPRLSFMAKWLTENGYLKEAEVAANKESCDVIHEPVEVLGSLDIFVTIQFIVASGGIKRARQMIDQVEDLIQKVKS